MIRKVCFMSMAIFTVLASVNFAVALTPERELGKLLYFDRYLSANKNQSCSTCHDPAIAGFADPLDQRLPTEYPVSVGSFTNLVGGRNALMASYALFSPPFSFDASEGL
jgi:cytochrome c peroxidase